MLQKTKVVITYKGKHAELFLTQPVFLVEGDKIKKITNKIEKSDANELNKALSECKGRRFIIDAKLMKVLKKELGDFEICI